MLSIKNPLYWYVSKMQERRLEAGGALPPDGMLLCSVFNVPW